jgi:hypothetical protein
MKATGKQRTSKGKIKGKVELRVWPEHGTFGVGVDETTGIWRICLQGKPKKKKKKRTTCHKPTTTTKSLQQHPQHLLDWLNQNTC